MTVHSIRPYSSVTLPHGPSCSRHHSRPRIKCTVTVNPGESAAPVLTKKPPYEPGHDGVDRFDYFAASPKCSLGERSGSILAIFPFRPKAG